VWRRDSGRSMMADNARAMREVSAIHRPPLTAQEQWFRLMKAPLATSSRGMTRDLFAGQESNQPTFLISAVNVTGCLPSNGYMDINTTIIIFF